MPAYFKNHVRTICVSLQKKFINHNFLSWGVVSVATLSSKEKLKYTCLLLYYYNLLKMLCMKAR